MAMFTSFTVFLIVVLCVRNLNGVYLEDGLICEKQTATVSIGKSCEHFKNDPCLCEISGSCMYNMESKKCDMSISQDCSAFSNDATLCRRKHCSYDCATGSCMNEIIWKHDCASNLQCSEHCSDICFCKSSGCQYSTDGSCLNKDADCAGDQYGFILCGRTNGFYSNKGVLCQNKEPRGYCRIEKTVLAVNLAGTNVVDNDGVIYEEEKENLYEDPLGIRIERVIKSDTLMPATYDSAIESNSTLRSDGRCVSYTINICEDGLYELKIVAIQEKGNLPGEKTFNIKLAGEFIFTEVDVAKLSSNTLTPVELLVVFEMRQNIMVLHNLGSTKIICNSTTALEFCYGNCIFMEGGFQIASFSINKLEAEFEAKGLVKNYCANFDNTWDCLNNGCWFDYEERRCMPRDKDCKDICKPKCQPDIEVVFLIDSTTSHEVNNDGKPDDWSIPFDEFQRLIYIADLLKTNFPRAKFGVTLYSDFYCEDWAQCGLPQVDGRYTHNEPEGCYRNHAPLTSDLHYLKMRCQRKNLKTLYSIYLEPAIFGAFMAVQDRSMHWTSRKGAYKVIVIITDDGVHTVPADAKNVKGPPKGDGTDSCSRTIHPSIPFLSKHFQNYNTLIFAILDGDDKDKRSFNDVLTKIGVPYALGYLYDDISNLAQQITDLVTQQHCDKKKDLMYKVLPLLSSP